MVFLWLITINDSFFGFLKLDLEPEEKVMTMLLDVQMKLVEDGKTSELAFANYSALEISKMRFLFVPCGFFREQRGSLGIRDF